MSRRVSGAFAFALALSLSVSACSGGDDDPSAAGTKPAGTAASPSESPNGEAAISTESEAFAAMQDYVRRDNALIRRSRSTPHDAAIWRTVDGESLLAADRYYALAVRNGWDYPDHRWRYAAPVRVYAPASTTWPKVIAVAARATLLKPDKEIPPDGPGTVELAVLQQEAEGAPWKKVVQTSAALKRLPKAAAIGAASVATEAQRARALELARRLPAYWATGRKPVDFADVTRVDEIRRTRGGWLRAHAYRDVRFRARLAGGEAAAVRTFRVEGGVVAIAQYHLWTTWVANSTIHWMKDAASAWGTTSRPRLTATSVADAAFFVPDGGKARGLAFDSGYALF
jgi:hypothetical protein